MSVSTFLEGEKHYQNSQEGGTYVSELKVGGPTLRQRRSLTVALGHHRLPLCCALVHLHHLVPTQGLAPIAHGCILLRFLLMGSSAPITHSYENEHIETH